MMTTVKYPVSKIIEAAVKLKNYLYNKNILKPSPISIPLISVGNLSLGGTGKTAVIDYLIQYLQSKNIIVGVVSRGYKGTYKHIVEVDLNKSQNLFGDEPYMLKSKYPKCAIILSKDRRLAYDYLLKNHKVDIVLADDSFQHRKLGRSIDIVVFDALEKVSSYKLFPSGVLREPLSSLQRADIIILNKLNLADDVQINSLNEFFKIEVFNNYNPTLGAYIGSYQINQITQCQNSLNIEAHDFKDFLMVSGIGQPVGFEKVVKKITSFYFEHLVFPDHFDYDQKSVNHIQKKMKALNVSKLLVTEKDFVKLNQFKELKDCLYVTNLQFNIEENIYILNNNFQGKEHFDEVLSRLLK
jgi:tetraacyldisaccharide 4'-kinase